MTVHRKQEPLGPCFHLSIAFTDWLSSCSAGSVSLSRARMLEWVDWKLDGRDLKVVKQLQYVMLGKNWVFMYVDVSI